MDVRGKHLEEVAKKIKEIEKEYQVMVISDNGYTGALIVDCVSGTAYQYHYKTGTIEEYE